MPVLEQLVVAQRQGPRPDEAHLPAQDVDDLRQLVDRESPQHATDARHARVVPDLEQRARRLVVVLELLLLRRPRRRPSCGTSASRTRARRRRSGGRRRRRGRASRASSPARRAARAAGRSTIRRALTQDVEGRASRASPTRRGSAGRSSNSGTPCPATYSPFADEQLGRVRGEAHPDAVPVSLLDDVENGALVEVGLGEDQLVGPNRGEDRRAGRRATRRGAADQAPRPARPRRSGRSRPRRARWRAPAAADAGSRPRRRARRAGGSRPPSAAPGEADS